MSLMSDEQMLAGRVDLLKVRDAIRSARSPAACFLQHLAVADDGVQRRAQLVAHVGEELALGAVGGLRRVLRLEQRLFRALAASVML